MDIACTFFANSHDNRGRRVKTTWLNLCNRLQRHDEGEKDGPALTCATFIAGQPRRNVNVAQRTLVAFDIETNRTTGEIPLPVEAAISSLIVRQCMAMVWTTFSHTPDAPRYRVLMPLAQPVAYQSDIDPFITAATALQMRWAAVCDASKYGAASLFYLPRHRADAPFLAQRIDGEPIDVGRILTHATTRAQQVWQSEAERAALRAERKLSPELVERIKTYNQSHPIAERLAHYGYRRDGGRWRSPYQHGQGATTILPDGSTWVSFSESDAANGVGRKPLRASSQCACFGDSFSLYCHYEMHGDFRAALDSIRGE